MSDKKKTGPKYISVTEGDSTWLLLDKARMHHPHLAEAKITLAYRRDWKADKDGLRTLGKCKKVSAVEKLFHGYDFVIILNFDVWMSEVLDEKKRLAILDHELCHAQVVEDKDGATVTDHEGRPKWRCRKHDLEEFRDIVNRHGVYKQDILDFVKEAMEKMGQPLLDADRQPVGVTLPEHEVADADPETGEIREGIASVETPLLKAVRDLCPSGKDGLDSIEIECGGKKVKLDAGTRANANKELARRRGAKEQA
jgi:hypothetical protein